jgi:acetyl-CoA hydrolase
VVWGQACAEPPGLTEALLAQRSEIGRFRCVLGIPAARTVRPEHADLVSFVSYTGSGANRELYRAGVLDVLPCHYSRLPDLIASQVDVVLLLLAPPDADGSYRLGLAEDYLPAAIASARVVIAEVSEAVPVINTGHRLTGADLDVVVRTSAAPLELVRGGPNAVEERIAARVAELVEDGATLQVGLGALPEAVLGGLSGHRDLGVHSGLIGDRVAELMATGVITNARKATDRGVTVGALLAGSRRLFDFADGNPALQLRDARYTHDPEVLAGQDRFVAINSALEVDLSGQVNAEVAGGNYVGAVGGAVDFLRGAARSRGGVPIVALPAERIVATLSGPVSTARSDAGVIVTEYGVADLRGQPLRARRERLIGIAHPDRQADLDR